ncbi:MAG: hypothetical protein AMXMBFR64_40520 [Myxococcales bacterium]
MRRALVTLVMLALAAPATGAPPKEPPMHRDTVNTAAVSADGATLLTGSTSGEVVWWSTAPFRAMRELVAGASGEERGRIAALAVDARGERAAVAADWAKAVEVWTLLGDAPAMTPLPAHGVRTTALAWSPDGLLATAGHDRGPARADDDDDALPPMLPAVVRLWSGTRLVRELEGPPGRVTALAFGPGGHLSAGGDGEAREWDAATGALRGKTKTAGQVAAIVYVGDERCVVAAEGAACGGAQSAEVRGVRAPTLAAAVTAAHVAAGTYEALVVTRRSDGSAVAQIPGRAAAVVPVRGDLWAVFESSIVVLHEGAPSGASHNVRVLAQ